MGMRNQSDNNSNKGSSNKGSLPNSNGLTFIKDVIKPTLDDKIYGMSLPLVGKQPTILNIADYGKM